MMWKSLAGLFVLVNFASFSASNNYQLKSYGVNSGGTNSSSSSTYSLQAGAGEATGNVSGATTYKTKSGSIEAQQANVPGAPAVDNNDNTYFNKLHFVINTASNPSDTTYTVAVSTTSNFTVTNYVQADGTLASSQVFQTYAQWGGASGSLAVGLSSSTTYYFKVAAMQGKFTASGFGPSANATTVPPPSLSFSVSPNTIDMGSLSAGSIISQSVSFNFTTNAANGGAIYMSGQNTGLHSANASHTIDVTAPSGDLSSLAEGFGLQDSSASDVGVTFESPYNGTSGVVGSIYTSFYPIFSKTSSISSGTMTAALKAKASATTPSASDYTDTLTFVAAASY